MSGLFGVLFFLGYMGIGGALETGGSIWPAIIVMAITGPAAYFSYKREERREQNEHRSNPGNFSSSRNAK